MRFLFALKAGISRQNIIAFIVALALFMDALDTTIINTAIPAMASSLRVNPVDLKIALISYLISLAIFIPISGWIGEKFGVKRVFMAALIIFTLSSIWCGFSTSLLELVMARSCQGLGGSLMLPLGRLIILQTFKRHELVSAMNAVVMVVSLGLMLGPLAGGFITDHLSWHWIFWMNIPIGLAAVLIAWRFLVPAAPQKVHAFDFLGFILFGGGLAVLTFSLSKFSESGARHDAALITLIVSCCMLITYFIYAHYQAHPILNTRLFSIRTFRTSTLGNLFARLGFGGIPFLLPLLLQVALGYSAQLSGLLLVPMAVGVLLIKPVSLPALKFFGYKRLLLVNTCLVGLSLWLFDSISIHTPLYLIGLLTFLFGLFISLQYGAMNSLAYSDISSEDLSAATSIMSTIQQVSQSFGVASAAVFLRLFSNFTEHISLTVEVFHKTFFALGWMTFLSLLVFIQLKPSDGYQMLTAPNKNDNHNENQH